MAKVVALGFDPRKHVSTVSHVCSDCGTHLDIHADAEGTLKEKVTCSGCGAEIVIDEIVWKMPSDIEQAMSKQTPVKADKKKCPVCKTNLGNVKPNYCRNCGQRIEW